MITTHPTVVILPTEFAAHRMQRMFLTPRHATRMTLPAPIVARRAMPGRPAPRYAPSDVPVTRNWSSLASVLLMVAVVVLAVVVTGVRL